MSMFVITESLPQENRSAAPFAGMPPVKEAPAANGYLPVKAALDLVLGFVLLIVAIPIVLLAVILIKLTSAGPAIYTQTRIGRYGQPFTIYKLRSMTHNCESLTGAMWATPGDSRVTTVGRWLRRTHIDELPQLWNVLRGEMSLIGPRPERPEFLPALEQAIPCYRQRLHVRPGLTGFAQVQLPPDSDLDSVRIKLAYDLHYLHNMRLLFELRIYVATVFKVLGVTHETIRSLCRFPACATIESDYRTLAAVRKTT